MSLEPKVQAALCRAIAAERLEIEPVNRRASAIKRWMDENRLQYEQHRTLMRESAERISALTQLLLSDSGRTELTSGEQAIIAEYYDELARAQKIA